jgi:hypothetical protein
MSEERARGAGWIGAGRVWVNGEVVTDPDLLCRDGEHGDRWVIGGA